MSPPSASSASADSAQGLAPCPLLDESAIESTLGADVTQKGPASDEFRGRSCKWTVADPNTVAGESHLAITTYHGSAFYLDGTIGDPVADIGDEAQGDPQGGTILFRKGEEVVQVQILTIGQSDLAGKASLLAKAAADAVEVG